MTTRTQTTGVDAGRVADELHPLQVDLMALAMQGKQLHWNVEGPQFMSVHLQLDTIVNDARAWTDEVAERIVTVGGRADGQPSDVTRESSLPEVPHGRISDRDAVRLIAERVSSVASKARTCAQNLNEVDLGSQDICIGIQKGLEKHQWMLWAQMP